MKVGEVLKVKLQNDSIVYIERLPDDPLCNRISAGGKLDDGLYIRFRGELTEISKILVQLSLYVGVCAEDWEKVKANSTIEIKQ